MTALINPTYDSNQQDSPTDGNANTTTVSVSDIVTDALANQITSMSMKLDPACSTTSKGNNTDSNITVDNHNNAIQRRNSGSGGKSRTKYASTDLSEMGIGDPLDSLMDGGDNSQTESDDGRLTVADDNILREMNKKKAEAMFADIDFIDDGDEEDSEEDESDDEEKLDVSKDEQDVMRVKVDDAHIVEYDEDDSEEEEDSDGDVSEDEDASSGAGSPKDPDADVASPDDEVIAAKLGGFLSYYANLESLAKSRVELEDDDDDASLNGSDSDSDLSENHEGLYEPPQHEIYDDSGPSTMDEESTDCESTYDMLYKSFGLRTQDERHKDHLLSPMGGQPDHGYASETSTDDKTSPIKRPGLLVNDSSKPSLSTLIEDSKTSSPDSHCSKLSPTAAEESGIEVTPEPKSNLEPLKNAILAKPISLPPGWREVADTRGTYYWHVPSGTTQWTPPSPSSSECCGSPPKKPARAVSI